MASNYPTSLDNFTNPTSNDSLNSPSHSLQHANINDAVEAIEAKLGIGASTAGSAISGQVLTAGTGGTTTWQTLTIPEPGLTLITSFPFTTSSTFDITNVFSSTYRNYRIILDVTAASAATIQILGRLLSGTTPATGLNYNDGYVGLTNGGSALNANSNSVDAMYFGTASSTVPGYTGVAYDILTPNLAEYTKFIGVTTGYNGSVIFYRSGGSTHGLANAYDGIRIFTNTGTISGVAKIYGYKN